MSGLGTLRAPHKLLVYGEYGAGKTTLATVSLIEYLRDGLKLKPEQVRIGLLDNDGGIAELVEGGLIDPAWQNSFIYALCSDWPSLMKNTDEQLKVLKEWQAKNGPLSAWQVTDNVDASYKWCRTDYAMRVFGMTEADYAAEKRQEQVAAGKKGPPSFNSGADWGVIGQMHTQWAQKVVLSGVNFIWTAPESDWTAKDRETGEEVRTIKAKGQKENDGRVSHIIRLHVEQAPNGDPSYFADLEKNRGGTKLFKNMPNPTYLRLRKWLDANSPAAQAAKAQASAVGPTSPVAVA